jgi:hypothetical protein
MRPLEERVQREAKLVYDEVLPEVYSDIFGDERMSPSTPDLPLLQRQ